MNISFATAWPSASPPFALEPFSSLPKEPDLDCELSNWGKWRVDLSISVTMKGRIAAGSASVCKNGSETSRSRPISSITAR